MSLFRAEDEHLEGHLLRAAINHDMFFAQPHKALPRAKNARAMSIVTRRPNTYVRRAREYKIRLVGTQCELTSATPPLAGSRAVAARE